jgi:hypothetical protein
MILANFDVLLKSDFDVYETSLCLLNKISHLAAALVATKGRFVEQKVRA